LLKVALNTIKTKAPVNWMNMIQKRFGVYGVVKTNFLIFLYNVTDYQLGIHNFYPRLTYSSMKVRVPFAWTFSHMQLKSVIKPDILVMVTNEESKKLWSCLYVILRYLEVSTESLADSLLHYTGISGSSFLQRRILRISFVWINETSHGIWCCYFSFNGFYFVL
jgi:hypothetical protein